MKWFATVYICTAAVLLPLDLIFISTAGKKLFQQNVPDMMAATPRMSAAALFYVVYVAGIVTFVNGQPHTWSENALYSALFGLFCYATFELTNMALMKQWTWSVVVVDVAWGMAVTAIAAAVGGLLAAQAMRWAG